jgi:hypothetical protein
MLTVAPFEWYLLVMPMMRMLLRLSTPSILDSNWFTIESATPVLSLHKHKPARHTISCIKQVLGFASAHLVLPLVFMMASISSKMITCSIEASPISFCNTPATTISTQVPLQLQPQYASIPVLSQRP